MDWLALSSHEVGHTKDITEIGGGILKYFSTFAVDYLKSGSHDATPREARAEHGAVIFQRFTDFTNKNYGKGALDKLFNSPDKDADKIKTLDTWFKAFSTAEEQKVFPNYDGNEDKRTKP